MEDSRYDGHLPLALHVSYTKFRLSPRTIDYLPLEGLLNLFARALPSTNKSAAGRARRTAYIQSVFVASATPEAKATGREVAGLLEDVPSSDWEETAARIIDALANGNIAL